MTRLRSCLLSAVAMNKQSSTTITLHPDQADGLRVRRAAARKAAAAQSHSSNITDLHTLHTSRPFSFSFLGFIFVLSTLVKRRPKVLRLSDENNHIARSASAIVFLLPVLSYPLRPRAYKALG